MKRKLDVCDFDPAVWPEEFSEQDKKTAVAQFSAIADRFEGVGSLAGFVLMAKGLFWPAIFGYSDEAGKAFPTH